MAKPKKSKPRNRLSDTSEADEGDTRARARLAKKGVKRDYTDPEAVNKGILGGVAMFAGGGPEALAAKLGSRALSRVGTSLAERAAARGYSAMKNVTPKAAAKSISTGAKARKAITASPAKKALTTAPERSPKLPARYLETKRAKPGGGSEGMSPTFHRHPKTHDPGWETIMQEQRGYARVKRTPPDTGPGRINPPKTSETFNDRKIGQPRAITGGKGRVPKKPAVTVAAKKKIKSYPKPGKN
jgi:hypothetical protein